MNSYLVQFYNQPVGVIIFVQFFFVALGGYVSRQTGHGPHVVGRSLYFLGIMACLLFYAVLGYIWLLGAPLASSGSTSYVVVVTMIGHGVLGYILGKIGSARSMDFSQSLSFGWLAFIPILQLCLVFPKTVNVSSKRRKPYSSWLAVVAGIFCYGLGVAIHLKSGEYQKKLINSPQTIQGAIEQYGLEEAIRTFVAGLDVPQRSLVDAQAFPAKLSLTYLFPGDIKEISPVFAIFKLAENCKNSVFSAIVDAGGEVVSIYVVDNNIEIGRIVTNRLHCEKSDPK